MIVHHEKLVRDRIPEIIAKAGKTPVIRVLPEAEYLAALDAKLTEELAEYQADKSPEELADLLEVLMAAAEARGYGFEQIERIRQEKAEKRGGFRDRIWLEYVESASEGGRNDAP